MVPNWVFTLLFLVPLVVWAASGRKPLRPLLRRNRKSGYLKDV